MAKQSVTFTAQIAASSHPVVPPKAAREIAVLFNTIQLAKLFMRDPSDPAQFHRWQLTWAECMTALSETYGIDLANIDSARAVREEES